MGGPEKWSVTYTKHIKQKRKVFQDGFLELDFLSHKVILYDDCENILHSRFVKKDEIIKSGETLAFDCYLVDIGEPHGDRKPLPVFNTKVTMTSKSFQSPKIDRKPKLGTHKTCMRNLSPSQKVIREFKKTEMNKYGSSPGSFDTTKSSKMEWQVLYTTQITQKAKKYHDGILRLLICGSQKQILLYDANRRLLDSRFLKKDEVIRSGESITFDGHLVDIGECEGDNKPPVALNLEGRNCHVLGETKAGVENVHSQEWEVMYTTQVTQKPKKFSNGILKLAKLGSHQMQVILLAEDGTILGRRYLQSSESVRTGSTLLLQNYLVELGDLCSSSKDRKLELEGELENSHSSWKAVDSDRHTAVHDIGPKEASPRKHYNSNTQCFNDQHNVSGLEVGKKPVRIAQEILSFLKKPMTQKDVGKMERQSLEGSHASQSCPVHNFDAGNQMEQQPAEDVCSEASKIVDLNKESMMHKQMSETSTTEAVKVLSDEITRSGCISKDMVDICCGNTGEASTDHPAMGPILVPVELDLKGKQPISTVLQDCSTEILEKGHCTTPVSCDEDLTGAVPAAPGIPIPLFGEVEPENTTQPCTDSKQIDGRWEAGAHVIVIGETNDRTSHYLYDDKLKIAEQGISTEIEADLPSFDLGF